MTTTTHRLSDLQLVLLATAARRENGSLLPPPDTLTHPRAVLAKAITALIRRKLAAEVDLEEPGTEQRTLDDRCWRQKGARLLGVVITDAGRGAIGAEEPMISADPDHDGPAISPVTEPATKKARVVILLQRAGGATLAELVAATGWLPHTPRAALTRLRHPGLTQIGRASCGERMCQ